MTRQTVYDETVVVEFDGCTLSDVLKEVQHLIGTYGEDSKISKESHMYEDGYYFAIMKPRLENDEEYNKRMQFESSRKVNVEKYEKDLLEKLKAKYETE